MSRLHFRDIQDWTPASISIVDKPYHPLATFEVYENDDEFIKKYVDIEVDKMNQNNDDVTVSGSFVERLVDKIVAKNEPAPNETDDVSKEILEKLNTIEENQAKTDERLSKLENPEPVDPEPTPTNNPDDGNNDEDGEGENDGDGTSKTVELPLNSDGTLNIEDEVVVKYLPKNYTPSSQSVDPDLIKGNTPDKSFNERSGRNFNGMTW